MNDTKRSHELPPNLAKLREVETASYELDTQEVRKVLVAVTGKRDRNRWMTWAAIGIAVVSLLAAAAALIYYLTGGVL